jgi:hypothetical protein
VKTPDEILKMLDICLAYDKDCHNCPYCDVDKGCKGEPWKDAALIRRLNLAEKKLCSLENGM